jgi:N,N'-diacetylchitobiose transport system permease protein
MTAVDTETRGVVATRPRPRRVRLTPRAVAYLLIAPTALVLAGVEGYPLVRLVVLSFQNLTQRELFSGATPAFAGFANYAYILTDPQFWQVVLRTVVFTVTAVGLTVLLSTGIALLMRAVATWCRMLLVVALICVWAMPQVASTLVFNWLFDPVFGVVNWLFGLDNHDWYVSAYQGFTVITAIVVWGAIPFVAITLYAGLTQVPRELEEAARVDGAGPFAIFRNVTYPILRPLYTTVSVLSVIWDFQVFNQIWVARSGKPEPQYWTLGIYSFVKAFGVNEYSHGAAIAIVTVVLLLTFTVFYIRQSLRLGELDA